MNNKIKLKSQLTVKNEERMRGILSDIEEEEKIMDKNYLMTSSEDKAGYDRNKMRTSMGQTEPSSWISITNLK